MLINHRAQRRLIALCVFSVIIGLHLTACSQKTPSPTPSSNKALPPGALSCEQLSALPTTLGKQLDVNFSNRIKLVGITTTKRGPTQLSVDYYWAPLDTLGQFDVIFVHLADSTNTALIQNDHPLCNRELFNTATGKYILDSWMIDVPAALAGKTVHIRLGIYSSTSSNLSRLPITSSGGVPMDDDNTRADVETITL